MDFVEWLRKQIDVRGWSQNELARRSGATSGYVSMVLSGMRQPGPEFCQGVARAFKIPETVVFVQAGLMSPARGEGEATFLELWEMLRDLPVEEQRAILDEARQRWQKAQPSGIEPATS